MAVPVFRALRDKFPDAHISALINKGTEETLSNNTLIDKLIIFDSRIKKENLFQRYKKEFSFLKMIRSKNFDLTIDLTGGDRASIISFVSGAKQRLGWKADKGFPFKNHIYTDLTEVNNKKHIVLQNLEVIKNLAVEIKNLAVDFYITDEERSFIKKILAKNNIKKDTKIIHIHPTSRWLFKCWKDEYMTEIINWLIQQNAVVIMTSSPDKKEIEKAEKILSMVKSSSNLINLCGKTNLKQLGAISKISDLFFGVDSAPMHIAAGVGTPVIALFGPSGAFNWGPWDNSSKFEKQYPKKSGVQISGIHTVIQKDWDCIPCGKDGCGGSKISKCLYEISPEQVKKLISEKLKGIKS